MELYIAALTSDRDAAARVILKAILRPEDAHGGEARVMSRLGIRHSNLAERVQLQELQSG